MDLRSCFLGCFYGGAIGSSIGRLKQEGQPWNEEDRLRLTGITQSTLFAAEGLALSKSRILDKIKSDVFYAYFRWLRPPGYTLDERFKRKCALGWLRRLPELRAGKNVDADTKRVLMGKVCGSIQKPEMYSDRWEGMARVAPVGLYIGRANAFKLGAMCAAITHGHPNSYLAAGTYAHIIACIADGMGTKEAVMDALTILKQNEGRYGSCRSYIYDAMAFAEKYDNVCSAEGHGSAAYEALAIGIYYALRYKDSYRQGVCASISHDGNIAAVGTITGSILGASLGIGGEKGIHGEWVGKLELLPVVVKTADCLYNSRLEIERPKLQGYHVF